MTFHRSLSDSKSPRVSRTLLSIQADLNNALVWMVSIHSPISNSSSPLTKPVGTVPSAPVTIVITVTLMFHSFVSLLLFYSFESFSYQLHQMVSHWSLSDSKSPQVSRTYLCNLADLNNLVVWMVSTRPLISKSSTTCTNPLVTVPNAPITISITVIFMFHEVFFFSSLARSRYLSFFSLSFSFTFCSVRTAKFTIRQVLLFSSHHIPAFCLCPIIFGSCCRFLICVSNRISHPGFEFLFVFFRGTPILSWTNFALA